MSILPSKKIILIIVACAIVVVGIYVLTREVPAQTHSTQEITPYVVVADSVQSTAQKDSDGDGLYDWEEILWGTDPFSPDTDKNGITDDKEIEQKKLLQKNTPADSNAFPTQPGSTVPAQPLTLTDKLALETFAQYVNLKQTGAAIDSDYAGKIAQNILGASPLDASIPKFSSQNLSTIIQSDTTTDIYTYGNDLWNIMVENTPTHIPLQNEYVMFLSAVQKQDKALLEPLGHIAGGYENTITDFLTMPVPQSAVSVHINFINNMNAVLGTIEDMRVYFDDPARGLSALIYYQSRVSSLKKSLVALIDYLKEKEIEYVEGESGYRLMHSI